MQPAELRRLLGFDGFDAEDMPPHRRLYCLVAANQAAAAASLQTLAEDCCGASTRSKVIDCASAPNADSIAQWNDTMRWNGAGWMGISVTAKKLVEDSVTLGNALRAASIAQLCGSRNSAARCFVVVNLDTKEADLDTTTVTRLIRRAAPRTTIDEGLFPAVCRTLLWGSQPSLTVLRATRDALP